MLSRDTLLASLKTSLHSISSHLEDPTVSEVMINPGGKTFVERAGEMIKLDVTVSSYDISMAIKAVGKLVNQDVISNSAISSISSTVDDIRIAGALSPLSHGGHSLCIRKHQKQDSWPSLDALVQKGMLSERMAENLRRLFITQRRNFFLGGQTGSGKTTVANALLMEIPYYERVVAIEDAKELEPGLDNYVPFLTNPQDGVTAQDLVKLALRYRPDRLILGETRGTETFDVIRAFNSGHDGSLSTVHASSAEDVCGALEMLFQMSVPRNASLTSEAAQRFIARAVHVIVYVARRYEEEDGRLKSVRRVEDVVLLKGVENGFFKFESVE